MILILSSTSVRFFVSMLFAIAFIPLGGELAVVYGQCAPRGNTKTEGDKCVGLCDELGHGLGPLRSDMLVLYHVRCMDDTKRELRERLGVTQDGNKRPDIGNARLAML